MAVRRADPEVAEAPDPEPPCGEAAPPADPELEEPVLGDDEPSLDGDPWCELPGGPPAAGGLTGLVGTDGTLTVMLGVLTEGVVTGPTVTGGTVTDCTLTDGTLTDGTLTDGTLTEGIESAELDGPDCTLPSATALAAPAEATSATHAASAARMQRLTRHQLTPAFTASPINQRRRRICARLSTGPLRPD